MPFLRRNRGCVECGLDHFRSFCLSFIPLSRLQNKVAIVTGGTRGLGAATARRFADEGAHVVITGRHDPVPGPGDRDDPSLRYVRADSASRDQIEHVIAQTVSWFGGFDVLVNNAGIEVEKNLEATTDEEYDRLMNVNVRGVFFYTRAAIPVMRERGGGSIINLGSISASHADPGLALYNTSKAAVLGLTRSCAVEVGGDGIRCNAICPGWIQTEMLDQTFAQASDPDAARAAVTELHPLGRLGQPDDIANIALWLASDESSFASGQTFTIDGGLVAGTPANPNLY